MYKLVIITKSGVTLVKNNCDENEVGDFKKTMMSGQDALCFIQGANIHTNGVLDTDIEFCFRPRDIECFYSKPNA